jgi:hypothetical protein
VTVERRLVALPAADEARAGWGSHRCQGIHYQPSASPQPAVAFIATHYNVDFTEHYLAEPLAQRGFGFLGWNTRFRAAGEAHFRLEPALQDIAEGVRWLRGDGAETIVLLGNSGGGSLMAAHQARATGRDRGELFLSVAAHPGRPQVLTGWLDPAVRDESDPLATDPAFDMYDPGNGPPYADEFIARYRAAQRERNRRITRWAQAELERLAVADIRDRLFTVARAWADPRFMDPALDPSDRPCPACYLGDPRRANQSVHGLAGVSTLRSWLEMWSLDESPLAGTDHLAAITEPALVIQPTMDTGVFPSDAAAIADALGSADKQLVHLPGDHYFRGPASAREELADYIAGWVSDRV